MRHFAGIDEYDLVSAKSQVYGPPEDEDADVMGTSRENNIDKNWDEGTIRPDTELNKKSVSLTETVNCNDGPEENAEENVEGEPSQV